MSQTSYGLPALRAIYFEALPGKPFVQQLLHKSNSREKIRNE